MCFSSGPFATSVLSTLPGPPDSTPRKILFKFTLLGSLPHVPRMFTGTSFAPTNSSSDAIPKAVANLPGSQSRQQCQWKPASEFLRQKPNLSFGLLQIPGDPWQDVRMMSLKSSHVTWGEKEASPQFFLEESYLWFWKYTLEIDGQLRLTQGAFAIAFLCPEEQSSPVLKSMDVLGPTCENRACLHFNTLSYPPRSISCFQFTLYVVSSRNKWGISYRNTDSPLLQNNLRQALN